MNSGKRLDAKRIPAQQCYAIPFNNTVQQLTFHTHMYLLSMFYK